MKIIDPIQIITEYFKKKYGDRDIDVIFGVSLRKEIESDPECGGATRFGPDGSIVITIDPDLDYASFCEVYCHELAHAVCGYSENEDDHHNNDWKKVFDDLYDTSVAEYFKLAISRAKDLSLDVLQ